MEETEVKEFRKILRNFERALEIQNQSSCCCGVTITQCHALMELDLNDNITLNELASGIHLDKSTVSRTVESLVNNGLIDRTIPKSNRRTTRLALTVKGREVCHSINSGNNKYYRKALDEVPEDLRTCFLKGFEAFVNSMINQNKPVH